MTTDPETLLVTTIARHFPDARIANHVVDVGFVQLGCRLGALRPFSGMQSAQLLFDVAGSELGGAIQLSMTGYGPTLAEAIVGGACGWACSFGPVLRAALSDEVVDGVASFALMQRGTPFRVYVDAFDHVLHFAPGGCEDTATARERFAAAPWFAFHVLGGGTVELAADRPQLLSIFVGELPDRRIVEVKLDGALQSGFADLVAAAPPAPASQMVALREIAVIVPD
ncbi:MAG: hypothetical protein ABI867_08410 [Kofleriaceae bacterium]